MQQAGVGMPHLPSQLFPNLRGDPSLWDFILCIYIAIPLLVLRLICEAIAIPPLRTALKARKSNPEKLAVKVFDDAYTSLGAGVMVIWAWVVVIRNNDGCTPIKPSACLAGWPSIHPHHAGRVYWVAMLGFYLYEMIGTVIGRGPRMAPIMMFHHLATWGLMVVAYLNGLIRLGLMATALLDLSNPLLHAAKTLQHLGIPSLEGVKWMLFNVFAVVFLVARIITPPFSLIRVTVVDARVLPTAGYYVCNVFVFVLYALQVFWFYKIVRIAVGGGKDGDEGGGSERGSDVDKTE